MNGKQLFLTLIPVFGLFCPASAEVPLVFRVDMSVQAAQGPFVQGTDLVEVRGSFDGWAGGTELADADKDGIYEGTVELSDDLVGKTLEFKFTYIRDGVTKWEDSIPNRSYAVMSGPQTLDKIYFDNDSEISSEVKGEIRFEVDMNVQLASKKFTKGEDEVYVRGSKMGWGDPPSGLPLAEDPKRPGIYTGNYKMEEALIGDVLKYKYVIWRSNTSTVVWESGADKSAALKATDRDTDGNGYVDASVGLSFFDGINFNGILKEDTTVTFRLDMSQAKIGDTAFDPADEGVWVNGQFLGWWAWNSMPEDFQMWDDGKNGDEKAGDKIYAWTRLFKRGDARRLEYKYGVDSADNEGGFGNNHLRFINADGKYLMPIDVFGDMVQEKAAQIQATPSVIPVLGISRATGAITLTWPAADGLTFTLEHSESLLAKSWNPVASDVKPASGQVNFQDKDPARTAAPRGFYRAKQN